MERQKIMRFLSGKPGLEFTGEIETIWNSRDGDTVAHQAELSRNQCVKLRCVLLETFRGRNEDAADPMSGGLTHLIIAADNSGSMSGNPFRQVKEALDCIIGQCISSQDVLVEVILYNHAAKQLAMNVSNYKQVIETQKCTGGTNFTEAFGAIQKMAGSRGLAVTKTVVIFLTDGENTLGCGKLNDAMEGFRKHMNKLKHESLVHTLGFSSSHDLKFLTDLTKAGSTDGVYQYCDSQDGPQALLAKLLDLFDFATIDSHDIEIELNMANGHKFIADTGLEDTITVNGQIVSQNVETEDAQAGGTSTDDWAIELSAWVYLHDPSAFPKIHGQIKVPTSTKDAEHFVPVSILTLTRRVVESSGEKVLWNVQVQARDISILRHRFSKAVHDKKDLTKYEPSLEKMHDKLNNVQVYGVAGINKATRSKMVEEIAGLRKTADSLLKVLTDFKRGLGDSVSVLARTSDLRYQGQFKRAQARKQRMMDKRARKNIDSAKSAQNKLDSIKVDTAQLGSLSEDARNFFFCVLSQTNVTEVLLDEDDRVDCLGFGLAIQRPEHVLDDPTAIRVSVISGTLVSRSAMMDAWEHRIHIDGHMKAHGGFDFKLSLGVTTVGTSNEPINAWLPLFVCPTHWERVKILLKPSLGYFCTLDSLGYDYKQMDVMFLVLGNMISQLRPETIGEHQLRMLFAFQRTCAAMMKDYELTEPIMELINNFIKSTEGRTRDVVPNLLTLVGYLAALPNEKLIEIFGDDGPTNVDRFYMAIAAESVRRAAANAFRQYSDNTTLGLLFKLIFGNENKVTEVSCGQTSDTNDAGQHEGYTTNDKDKYSEFKAMCRNNERTTEELNTTKFDPSSGIEAPVAEMKHCEQWDKAMEVWAKAELGLPVNKNRSNQVHNAKKVVEKWKENCTESLKSSSIEQNPKLEDGTDESWKELSSSILSLMAEVLAKLDDNIFPSMSGLASCFAFIEFLVQNRIQMNVIDVNSGLAPMIWIDGVKQKLRNIFRHLQDDDISTIINESGSNIDDSDHSADDIDDDDSKGRRATLKPFPLQCERGQATMPEVLALFSGNLCATGREEVVLICRAMLCQALQYHNNTKARAAAKAGEFVDFSLTGLDTTYKALKDVHLMFIEKQKSTLQNELERSMSEFANFCMVRATTPWAFVGYLMNAYQDRGAGLHDLVQDLTDPATKSSVPGLAEKIKILVTGKMLGYAVLAKGNAWFPEKMTIARFQAAIGEEAWMAIEIEVRSTVAIHVYRESDLPNRHGHCNSNPYIPNWLRIKLGMELMDEKKDSKSRRRCRTHLTR